ncbi:MAG: glycerol acyltransferase [Chloroflexi bacterium]|nr:glycerol acyltransferase [Chloroflexota bacterium]
MKQRLSLSILHLVGWQMEVEALPPDKCIVVGAHHTTNWDFFAMLMLMFTSNLRFSWLGKDSAFRGPFAPIFRALGGIPVDRSSSQGLVKQMADAFAGTASLQLAISPEGTRTKSRRWRTGFYYIAVTAGVPIVLGYVDYPRKIIGLGPIIIPSGDINRDLELINDFYAGITGKYPEMQGKIVIEEEGDGAIKVIDDVPGLAERMEPQEMAV